MATYRIPLTAENQVMVISLAGIPYQLTLQWCDPAAAWVLSLADAAGLALLASVPLVTGVDLLAAHPHLGIAGSLIVHTDHDPHEVPGVETLGKTGNLYFVTA